MYTYWANQNSTTIIHYSFIEKNIERLGERYNIWEIAFDRWGALQMVQNLEGIPAEDSLTSALARASGACQAHKRCAKPDCIRFTYENFCLRTRPRHGKL